MVFSPDGTYAARWAMVRAGPLRAPFSTIRASRVIALARVITSSGMVAEKQKRLALVRQFRHDAR